MIEKSHNSFYSILYVFYLREVISVSQFTRISTILRSFRI